MQQVFAVRTLRTLPVTAGNVRHKKAVYENTSPVHWKQFCNVNNTFIRVIGILLN